MEKTLISWNVPNLITVWLMLAIGFLLLTVGLQYGLSFVGARQANGTAAGAGGY